MQSIQITSARIKIRELVSSDLEDLVSTSDSFTEESAREFIQDAISEATKNPRTLYYLGIEDLTFGKVVGAIEFRVVNSYHGIGEIGYWIGKTSEGKGLATEATKLFSHLVLKNFPLYRIQATSSPENIPSHRVLEKAGYQKEGLMRKNMQLDNHRRDSLMFSLIKDDIAT